jgi:glutathione S-transferase
MYHCYIVGGKVLFGQVPLLEIDGLNLVQTGAIVRYLARKYNLYGNNDKEATM